MWYGTVNAAGLMICGMERLMIFGAVVAGLTICDNVFAWLMAFGAIVAGLMTNGTVFNESIKQEPA